MRYATRRDYMLRAMVNLTHIEAAASAEGPFEVTALLSTFTGALMFHWDDLEANWPHAPQHGVSWPHLQSGAGDDVRPLLAREAIPHLRDALAHGNLAFESGEGDEICTIHTWTCRREGTVKRRLAVPVSTLREMLVCFSAAAEASDLLMRIPYHCRGVPTGDGMGSDDSDPEDKV